jgi:NAD(P)-dependent dehydrogenase (short-subunit alcohol dehydrogenase family)
LRSPQNCVCFRVDLLDETSINEAVDKVLARFGRIDILVNSAGINKREGILDVTDLTFERILGVQFIGVYKLSAEVVRKSMRKTGGKIINVGSYNSFVALGGSSVYAAAKSGVVSLTRSMCVEWARYGIQANCVCPGHFRTELTKSVWEDEARSGWLRERIACERPGIPQDLNGAFLLLASPASDYISGATLNVDGGSLAGGKPYAFDTEY